MNWLNTTGLFISAVIFAATSLSLIGIINTGYQNFYLQYIRPAFPKEKKLHTAYTTCISILWAACIVSGICFTVCLALISK